MKVLYVVHYPVFGAPHNQALRLSGPLAARGFTTVVVVPDELGNAVAARGNVALKAWFCSRTEPDRSWAVSEDGFRFPWRYLPDGRIRVPGLRPHYLNLPIGLLTRDRPDLLVSLYAEPAFVAGWWAARTAGTRVAFRYLPTFDSWVPRSRLNERLKRALFTRADGFKTSGPAGRAALEAYGCDLERIHTFTQSIDIEQWQVGRERWRPKRDQIREEFGAAGTTFLYVGRLSRGKGADDLLAALGSRAAGSAARNADQQLSWHRGPARVGGRRIG